MDRSSILLGTLPTSHSLLVAGGVFLSLEASLRHLGHLPGAMRRFFEEALRQPGLMMSGEIDEA